MALFFMLRLLLITLPFKSIAAMPYPPADQSPAANTAKRLFTRQQQCANIVCANAGGAGPIDRQECQWSQCGQCGTNSRCLPNPGDDDNYDPDDPGNPYGGGGQAGNGDGSGDSSGTCVGDLSDTAGSGSCPAGGTSNNAQCGGACNTGDSNACGQGCGCTWSSTGWFGGKDGTCHALVSFGSLTG